MITEIVNFENGRLQTPTAPTYKCSIFGSYLYNINLDALSTLILEKEAEITSLDLPENMISHGFTGLGPKALTSRFKAFNVLSWDHPEVRKLKQEIRYIYNLSSEYFGFEEEERVFVQCWANVLRKGEKMNVHRHSDNTDGSFLSGHFTVQCKDTQTVYQNPFSDVINWPEYYSFNNYPGKINIFNSYIYHYTTEHNDDSERITIAFDLFYREPPKEGKIIEL
jgi:Putative 2OG-Fe(II) oxygenase